MLVLFNIFQTAGFSRCVARGARRALIEGGMAIVMLAAGFLGPRG